MAKYPKKSEFKQVIEGFGAEEALQFVFECFAELSDQYAETSGGFDRSMFLSRVSHVVDRARTEVSQLPLITRVTKC